MKPSIPRGTRDFGPAEMQRRNYIFNIIKRNFELFGYLPLETPAMENLDTLMGKYGDEGDKLVYKIRSNKNLLEYHPELKECIKATYNFNWIPMKSDKALKYDLTVPFARYVVMNKHDLVFPFKRYQIQPVWRADNPQKSRYREFYQCDADVIGSDSLINEVELIQLMDKVFSELNLPVTIKFNNRKFLTGIVEYLQEADKLIDIIVSLDKLDKIGINGVNTELRDRGVSESAILKLQPLLEVGTLPENERNHNLDYIGFINEIYSCSEVGKKGGQEIEYLINTFNEVANDEAINLKSSVLELDYTLARGLNYYTGAIFEVKSEKGSLRSSIAGGGRYDDLTGIFGLPNMSGVGISFGIDRIYDVMEELDLFPESISKVSSTTLLFTHFDEASQSHCLKLASQLRSKNISCEVYPDLTKKLGKQFDYANKKNIPFVCTVGSNEMQSGVYPLKDMGKGEQQQMDIEAIINYLSKHS
jgi:histidyl-tRNA synthetase